MYSCSCTSSNNLIRVIGQIVTTPVYLLRYVGVCDFACAEPHRMPTHELLTDFFHESFTQPLGKPPSACIDPGLRSTAR